MQIIPVKSLSIVSLSVCMSLFLSACSSVAEVSSVKAPSSSSKTSNKALQHIHESNPCTAGVTHSHANNVVGHQHSYDCENTNEFVGNAHIHPATKVSKRTRHVHPNGANKHSHIR